MDKIRGFLAFLRTFLPSQLPVGIAQFDTFAASILETYSLPDLPSYKHAIATAIMHLGTTTAYKSKRYFALVIKKAMANQVAYEKIMEFKKIEEDHAKEATLKSVQ